MSNKFKYSIYGTLFGICFPVLGTLILMYDHNISAWEAQTKSGHLIWIIDSSPIILGYFAYFFGSAQDRILILNHSLQQHLKDVTNDYDSVLKAIQNEIYIFDPHSLKFIMVNESALINLGYDLSEIQSLTPLDLKKSMSADKFMKTIEPLTSGQVSKIRFTTEHFRKDGSHYPVEVHLQKALYHGTMQFQAIVIDQTENERLTRDLIHSSKLSSIGELAAGIAHEINNPLAIACTANETLKIRLELMNINNEKLFSLLDKQMVAFHRIQTIADSLQHYSRVDRSEIENLSLSQSVIESITLFRSVNPKCDMKITYFAAPVNDEIKATKGHLEQILFNLLSNARDATLDRKNPEVRITLERSSSAVKMVITDNGKGIPKDIQHKIFNSFYTTKKSSEGTGLGLGVVMKLVKDFGGEIHVVSEPEKGASFVLNFPSAQFVDRRNQASA